jgi:hypothetical protein
LEHNPHELAIPFACGKEKISPSPAIGQPQWMDTVLGQISEAYEMPRISTCPSINRKLQKYTAKRKRRNGVAGKAVIRRNGNRGNLEAISANHFPIPISSGSFFGYLRRSFSR